jgi:hypothetical protein
MPDSVTLSGFLSGELDVAMPAAFTFFTLLTEGDGNRCGVGGVAFTSLNTEGDLCFPASTFNPIFFPFLHKPPLSVHEHTNSHLMSASDRGDKKVTMGLESFPPLLASPPSSQHPGQPGQHHYCRRNPPSPLHHWHSCTNENVRT